VERAGKLKLVQVDASTNPELASSHCVASVPALFRYRQGQCVGQRVGFASKAELLNWLQPATSP
jgi:thioredoxin-like negative regulator of GroEL